MDNLEFDGYGFYELTNDGYRFKYSAEQVEEAFKFGANKNRAFSLLLSKYAGMVRRDHLIIEALKRHNITRVFDVGGDRGGLAKLLTLAGIDVIVFEPRQESIDYLMKNHIQCEKLSIYELIVSGRLRNTETHKTAVLCLNFTHVPWVNEVEKYKFFKSISDNQIGLFIFSWIGKLPCEFDGVYTEDKMFNPHAHGFYLHSKTIELLRKLRAPDLLLSYMDQLKIESEYSLMQRLIYK